MARMSAEEKSRLEQLDRILRSEGVRAQIAPIISRVQAELAMKTKALMTWEPIPLKVFGDGLPAGIQSSWVFVLRAGADTGAERHPNSHQRMMSIHGSGDMRTDHPSTHKATARQGKPGRWRSNFLISDPSAPLEKRWISIPPNVWHRPVIGKNENWIVVSFHTVPAEELIEERPSGADQTTQMKYLEGKVS